MVKNKMPRSKKSDQQLSLQLDVETEEPSGYTTEQVARVTGLTLRQVDTWTSSGIVGASVAKGGGSGTTRYYSYSDILEFNVAKKLRGLGQSIDKIKENFNYVRKDLKTSVYDSILICVDDQPAVVKDGEYMLTLASSITKTGKGQGILNLNILNLSEIKKEIDSSMDVLGITKDLDATELGLARELDL